MKEDSPIKHYLLLLALGALLFIPFLGQVHLFDWDEINFAESAREMIITGNYSRVQVNFHPFWEKPPLFIWMQVAAMKVFGIGEFAARLPNAICGIVSMLVLFYSGRRYFSTAFGWIWVMAYLGSFFPHFYFKSGIIDPWFNLFMFLGVLQVMQLSFTGYTQQLQRGRLQHVLLAGMFVGLAILTKGPVGLLIPMLTFVVYVVVRRDWKVLSITEVLLLGIVAAAISSVWYGMETIKNGWWFLQEFIDYHLRLMQTGDSGHGQPFYYHFVVVLIGCFPASFFLFPALFKDYTDTDNQGKMRTWMIVLMMVVLVVFSLVKTKIIHYSSMTYFPLTFLASLVVYKVYKAEKTLSHALLIPVLVYGLIIGLAFFLLPIVGNNPELLKPLIKDKFAAANLDASLPWPRYYVLAGSVFMTLVVVAFVWMKRGAFNGVALLYVSCGLLIGQTMNFFTPLIEPVTQGTAIEFLEEHADEDAYLNVLSYKSYAQYFYGRKRPADVNSPKLREYIQAKIDAGHMDAWPDSEQFMQEERQWHLHGDIDKPVYFLTKNVKAEQYRAMPQLQEIGAKNGWVFFKREP